MDKGLMALMGIEDDSARDEGLMEQRRQSREPTPFSDEDDDMESLDIATSTTKSSKQSRASSLSESVDTAMTTPVKDRSQDRSQDKRDPLGLFDTAMDDSDDEPLLPSTLTRSLNTPATQPSPSNPNYSTLRRNSPGPLSPHLGPAPRASTSSLFGSSGSTIRVTKSPKKPKKSNSMGGGSLFSPTLSPRKLKKPASAGFMSPTLSPARKPHSQPQTLSQPLQQAQPTPPSTSASQANSLSPASSLSSTPAFVLKKAPITFSDDSDSDISSLDGDNIFSRPPKGKPRPVDTEMAPFGGSVSTEGPEFTDKEVGADLVQAQPPKRISEKDRVKLRMEAERLKRSVPVPVPEIVNEKKTMSWLLQEAQNKLKQKKAQPSFEDTDLLPVARQTPIKKYRTIALDDDSDDETEEQAKWKQDAARALLVAHIPKDQRLRISKDLNNKTISPEKRSEVERILQMTPLSNKIRNMSLATSTSATNAASVTMDAKGSSSSSSSSSALAFLTSPKKSLMSPSKSQKPGTVNNIHQFNELMKRQLAKKNLERRKQLEEEAKKSGTWKSPEEHAAEQLRIEEKRRKGLDPDEDEDEEEDPDYDPKGKDTAPAGTVDDDEEMAYNSAGESGSGGESTQEEEEEGEEEEAEGDDEAELENQDVEASEEESDEEGEEEEPLEEPEEDEDAPVVKAKRAGARKKTVIGDDDEIRVTVVDRSQIKHSDSEQDHADHSDEGGDGDDDVSDLDEDIMEGTQGTQGFGAFFESSYNPNKGNKQEQLAALNRAPSASPTLDDDSEVTSSIGGALEFLSGGFPSATPARVQPSQSQSQEAYDGISPIVEDHDDEPGNTLPLPSQFNAFDVLKSATPASTPAVRRRLVQRQAKPSRGPISKHDKSAFIEYEAEEEEDEFMGMGGVDYESENDNDDYDLGDGMVDANNTLDLEDVRNVKALHMKHEQEQHDKEISDLVHGIAAGNLWKRRNGQADDMDIFDEDDINGGFRRKKKLKVSEKFEKLADNPSTAAFARAFEKNIGDDDLIFLSDPEESDHGDTEKSGKSRKKEVVEDEDADMTPGGQDEAEASEEELNTEKRAERLQQARLLRDGEVLSEVTTTTTTTVIKTKTSVVPGEEESLEDDNGQVDPIDEYKETMRRTKVIRNILDGFDDEVDLASQSLDLPSQRRTLPSTFNLLDRIIDKGPVEESAASMRTGGDVDVTAIARPRMLARQNSSFLSEERRTQFLSTVGEESRGGNAGNRMVKEVNRRKMAFATSKRTTEGGSSSSSSVSVTTTTTITPSSSSDTSSGKRVPGKVPRLPSDGSSSRLLSLLSFEEEE